MDVQCSIWLVEFAWYMALLEEIASKEINLNPFIIIITL
jgi:hypothetical protein